MNVVNVTERQANAFLELHLWLRRKRHVSRPAGCFTGTSYGDVIRSPDVNSDGVPAERFDSDADRATLRYVAVTVPKPPPDGLSKVDESALTLERHRLDRPSNAAADRKPRTAVAIANLT